MFPASSGSSKSDPDEQLSMPSDENLAGPVSPTLESKSERNVSDEFETQIPTAQGERAASSSFSSCEPQPVYLHDSPEPESEKITLMLPEDKLSAEASEISSGGPHESEIRPSTSLAYDQHLIKPTFGLSEADPGKSTEAGGIEESVKPSEPDVEMTVISSDSSDYNEAIPLMAPLLTKPFSLQEALKGMQSGTLDSVTSSSSGEYLPMAPLATKEHSGEQMVYHDTQSDQFCPFSASSSSSGDYVPMAPQYAQSSMLPSSPNEPNLSASQLCEPSTSTSSADLHRNDPNRESAVSPEQDSERPVNTQSSSSTAGPSGSTGSSAAHASPSRSDPGFRPRRSDESFCEMTLNKFSFEWQTKREEIYKRGRYKQSEPFYSGIAYQARWRMQFFPNGMEKAEDGRTSLRLVLENGDPRAEVVAEFSVTRNNDMQVVYTSTYEPESFEARTLTVKNFVSKRYIGEELITIFCRLHINCDDFYRTMTYSYRVEDLCTISDDYLMMFKKGINYDAIVTADHGTQFRVHKFILCARSIAFRKLFTRKDNLFFNNFTATEMEEFLKYVYSGKHSSWDTELSKRLLHLSRSFHVDGLLEASSYNLTFR